MLIRLLGIVVILLALSDYAGADMYCLSCNDVIHPTECDTIAKCGAHEVCFLDMFVTLSGYIRFNVGCRDRSHCPSGLGKRNVPSETVQDADVYFVRHERSQENLTVPFHTGTLSEQRRLKDSVTYEISMKRSSDLLACTECCEGDLCANTGCGTSGYPTTRGPICFNCDQQTTQDDCSKIKVCGQGEVCMLEKSISQLTHNALYSTRCASPKTCNDEIVKLKDLTSLLIGKRISDTFQIGGSCVAKCCSDDLCNNHCGRTSTSPLPLYVTTSATPIKTQISTTLPWIPMTSKQMNGCIYRNKIYYQDNIWQDGCQYRCTCKDAKRGVYICTDLCPVWNSFPTECSLQKKPGDCCPRPTCTANPITPVDGCLYKNVLYKQGEHWKDDCKHKCTCIDDRTGIYECTDLCLSWNLPQACHLSPPRPGYCCSEPVCPPNIHVKYPPGYTEN